MIKIKNLNKLFGNTQVLKNINLEIKKGEKIAIIGPSGSGKSTLLRCLNMLETPSNGQIWFKDTEITNSKTDINKIRQKMNMVFQNFNLFENKTIIDNITLAPIKLKKLEKEKAKHMAIELLKKVGLEHKANNFASQLSGGQKQRVAIVRALAMEPEVVLFDEPTSALDPERAYEVLEVIKSLAKNDLTMICVTHEMKFAKQIADQIVFMDNGEIIEQNSPENMFEHQNNERIKNFIAKHKN